MKQENHDENGPEDVDDSILQHLNDNGTEEYKRLMYMVSMLEDFLPVIEHKVRAGQFFVLAPPNNLSYMEN